MTRLVRRFFVRFFSDFTKTMKEDKMSYAAIPAAVLWFLINEKSLRYDAWIVIGPLVFGLSFVVCQHAYVAARAVIEEVEQVPGRAPRFSDVLDQYGNRTVLGYSERPKFYKPALYGIVVVLAILCLLACVWCSQQASIKVENIQKNGNANLEIVLKTPKWNEPTNQYEMEGDLTSSGSLSAKKMVIYQKYWIASSATGDRPTKEQVDRRFKAFEEENKYTPLGYNDVGLKQQAQVALKTEFVSDEEHEAVEHGKKWLYFMVIVKYADEIHKEIWSRACAEYDRGKAETCVGHNEAADLGVGSR